MPGPELGFVVCDSSGLGLLRTLTVLLGARAGAGDERGSCGVLQRPAWDPSLLSGSFACLAI